MLSEALCALYGALYVSHNALQKEVHNCGSVTNLSLTVLNSLEVGQSYHY